MTDKSELEKAAKEISISNYDGDYEDHFNYETSADHEGIKKYGVTCAEAGARWLLSKALEKAASGKFSKMPGHEISGEFLPLSVLEQLCGRKG